MNKRIRELLVEAGVINNNFNPLAYEQWYLDSLEKFAELIVRECASLAYDGPGGILDHFGLEEHFGVEE